MLSAINAIIHKISQKLLLRLKVRIILLWVSHPQQNNMAASHTTDGHTVCWRLLTVGYLSSEKYCSFSSNLLYWLLFGILHPRFLGFLFPRFIIFKIMFMCIWVQVATQDGGAGFPGAEVSQLWASWHRWWQPNSTLCKSSLHSPP